MSLNLCHNNSNNNSKTFVECHSAVALSALHLVADLPSVMHLAQISQKFG